MEDEGKSVTVHAILGIMTGAYHATLGSFMLPLMITTAFIMRSIAMSQDKAGTWWFSNGLWPYLTTFFAMWTLSINL